MSQASEYLFESLFGSSPIDTSSLNDNIKVGLMTDSGISVTTLGALKPYFASSGSGGDGMQWKSISASGTLEVGYSYIAKSSPSGLNLTIPTGIPVLSAFAVHARGGKATLIGAPNYVIAGTDGSVIIDDGNTIYLLHDEAGHLEIV